jgi:Fic family protein
MEREGLKPPELRMEAGAIFTVILNNTPVYSPETMQWLKQFEGQGLNPNQRRLLAYAHAHGGQFTSRSYQKFVGIDIYAASKDIKDLIRKGIARSLKKGGRVYEVVEPERPRVAELPDEVEKLKPRLEQKGYLKNQDVQEILGLTMPRANRVLRRLTETGWLRAEGEKRGRRYYLGRDIEQAQINIERSHNEQFNN